MAIGKPTYDYGDTVWFWAKVGTEHGEKAVKVIGQIYIVDAYGIFGDKTSVYYDILNEQQNMLYKHIQEDSVHLVETCDVNV